MPVLRRTTAALALACIALVTYAVLNPERAQSLRLVEISLLFPRILLIWRFLPLVQLLRLYLSP